MAIVGLVQYRPQSLIEHLRRAWRIGGRIPQNFITVVPPQMKTGAMVYEGTADAVFQNVNLIHDFAPDLVAVFGGKYSPIYVECLPVAHELRMLLMDPWGSADQITDHGFRPSFSFRLSLKDR